MDDQSKLECIHDKTVEIGGDTERKRKKKKKFCSDNQQKDGEGTLRCSGFGSKKAPLQRSNADRFEVQSLFFLWFFSSFPLWRRLCCLPNTSQTFVKYCRPKMCSDKLFRQTFFRTTVADLSLRFDWPVFVSGVGDAPARRQRVRLLRLLSFSPKKPLTTHALTNSIKQNGPRDVLQMQFRCSITTFIGGESPNLFLNEETGKLTNAKGGGVGVDREFARKI
jgi:hypothetical protein